MVLLPPSVPPPMASSYTPGIRERKKRETRNRLAKAAVDLITEGGLDAATIAAISQRADVSSRTFHNYFPHRDAAIMHFLEYTVDCAVECLERQPRGLHAVDVMKNVREAFLGDDNSSDLANAFAQVEAAMLNLRSSQLLDIQHQCFQMGKRLAQALSDYSEGRLSLFEAYIFLNISVVTSKASHAIQMFSDNDEEKAFGCESESAEEKAFNLLRSGFTGY